MTGLINATVHFIALHAAWTFPVMFITAFGESFVFLSLLFPGTTIMLAAGLLVPEGTIPLLPLLSGGILGAVIGDSVSWWLGKRYGYFLIARWPFTRHPELLARGEALFRRFGVLSVFVGRFFGPFRATIPLIAGLMNMPARGFWLANVLSALVWAPALLLPGIFVVWTARFLHVPAQWRLAIGAGAIATAVALIWIARKLKWFKAGDGILS
jgi:membrane protein DedA with SNARE-associated domain